MNESEQNRIALLLDAEDEFECCSDVDDDEEGDPNFEIFSDHFSESEESANEEENGEERGNFYVGRNTLTKWKKEMPPKNSRTRSHNIISHIPGVKGVAKNMKSELEIWQLFFPDTLLSEIVANTNLFIQNSALKYQSNPTFIKPTDIDEIKSLIGLFYLAGVFKAGRTNIDEFWQRDGTGLDIFWITMSLQRFRFLVQSIRFDNKETRNDRIKFDKLAPIRFIFDSFILNCKTHYSLGDYVTIDEMLIAFRGRCSFRMYIPSKPAKYGIKVFNLCDARTAYSFNLEVYLGEQPDGPYKLSNKPEDVVKRLCVPIYNSNRNITIDNWFGSYNLAISMLKDHKLTIVGTLRKNKKELPINFTNSKDRSVYSSLFGFQENCTIVSYVPKKNKCVILLSTMHHDNSIDDTTGILQKPEMITLYNMTKGGVDLVDQMSGSYNAGRTTNRWPLALFYSLLNVAGINSYVIYNSNNNSNIKRRLFLKQLGMSLVKKIQNLRAENKHVHPRIRNSIKRLRDGDNDITEPGPSRNPGTKGRCHLCADSKTQYFCCKCKKYLCLKKHANFVCNDCL